MVNGPEHVDVDDDEKMLEFVRANRGQGYHNIGTCKMGRKEDERSVVDTEFCSKGWKLY